MKQQLELSRPENKYADRFKNTFFMYWSYGQIKKSSLFPWSIKIDGAATIPCNIINSKPVWLKYLSDIL